MTDPRDLFDVGARAQDRPTSGLKGMAAAPGTGPDGETCRTCVHKFRKRTPAGYVKLKCKLMEPYWTCGEGTDIKAKYAACKHWESNDQPTN